MISVEGLSHRFGATRILDSIDLTVADGECIALVGANGAGKSTLIKSMLDIGGLDRGSIRIGNVPHTDRRARSRLAYLPERFQPPYYLRGREFIEYMLALYGRRPGDSPIDETCDSLGLPLEALARPVQTYSKGMAQMLGLAACLLSARPLLVLDEPMSGLDPVARVRLRDVLRERHADGSTIFFTTHLLADAEMLADRIAILHAGRIHAVGNVDEICAQFGAANLADAFAACMSPSAAVARHW